MQITVQLLLAIILSEVYWNFGITNQIVIVFRGILKGGLINTVAGLCLILSLL